MHIPVALSDVRTAIRRGHRMTFIYQREKVVADFYLLGQAKKTGAYIVAAWCMEPREEWRQLRYSLIQDLEPVGPVESWRGDFNPYHPSIASIDTLASLPRPSRPHN